ncbi:nucleotidyltransferase domain-containing protein [Jatrophihabitans lederbergiae]|uniref:Nucleotidyltransferase domain-containing protein n=1 Tax=Jatrophihabitans lederbergiae TaxID=3075547 RepID=A0ABU2J7Y7_9ACTN|nr:nucleotidyltransferase domain-containing protein [Jatrophihabitans sp. DSM 44399]MDT0261082.1 nucleotidyltransferase domain-containing protein [Jatrophihabitans sp. DSM 44399]
MTTPAPDRSAVVSALLLRIVELLRAEPRVLAAWLYGSHGRGDADEYSDLDVWVVTEDVDGLLADWPTLAGELGEVVLTEPIRGQPAIRCILADWTHYDLWVSFPDGVPRRGADTVRLLFDRAGLAQRLQPRATPAPLDVAKARALTVEFLRRLGNLPAVLHRGDPLYAVSAAQLTRLMLIELMLTDLRLADPGGAGHQYRALSADRRDALLALPAVENTLVSARDYQVECLRLFVPLARQLCGADFPEPLYRAVGKLLTSELGMILGDV